MTGTARPAAAEFFEAYRLRVAAIPTNRPPLRQDLPLRVYFSPAVRFCLWAGLGRVCLCMFVLCVWCCVVFTSCV